MKYQLKDFEPRTNRRSFMKAAAGTASVAGGLLENLSLLFGMRALLLIAMALYALAAIGLRLRHRTAGVLLR